MNSMTGFGRAEATLGTHGLVVEVSAVNRRNLEISLSLPKDWQDLDPVIQPRIKKSVLRGRIFFALKLSATQGHESVRWDDKAVASVLRDLRELAEQNDVAFEPDPSLLFRIATSQSEGVLPAWKDHQDALLGAVDAALDNFVAMRRKEGDAMTEDMLQRIGILSQILDRVEPLVPRQVPTYREALLKRLREADLEIDLDDERILKEISIYAESAMWRRN